MSSRREAAKPFSKWINPDDKNKIQNELQHTDWTQRSGNDLDDFIQKTLEPIIDKFVTMKTSLSRATHIQSKKQVESLKKQNVKLAATNKKNVRLLKMKEDFEKYKKTVEEQLKIRDNQRDDREMLLKQYVDILNEKKKKIEELKAQNKNLQIDLDAYKQDHKEQQQRIKNYEFQLYGDEDAPKPFLPGLASLPPPPLQRADDEQKNDNNVKPSANVINNALSENVYFDSAMRNILDVLKKDTNGRIVIHVQPKYVYGNFQKVNVHIMDKYKDYIEGKTIFGDASDIQRNDIKSVFPDGHGLSLITTYVLVLFKDEFNEDDFITNIEFLNDGNTKHDINLVNLTKIMERDLIVLTWDKLDVSDAKVVLNKMIESLKKQDYGMLADYVSYLNTGDNLYRKEKARPFVADRRTDYYEDDYNDMSELLPELKPVRAYVNPGRRIALLKNQIQQYISQLPPMEQGRYNKLIANTNDEKLLRDLEDKVKHALKYYETRTRY